MSGVVSRPVLRAQVTKAYKQFDALINSGDIISARVKAERIIEMSVQLEEIDQNYLTDDMDDAQVSSELDLREQYLEIAIRVRLFLKEAEHNNVIQPVVHTNIQLPKISLPVFGGCITEWPDFWETFEAVVHHSKSSDVQKFAYLKNVLSGEAKAAISGFILKSENYMPAVKLLKQKYGNKPDIVRAHIRSLINMRDLGYKSALPKFIEVIDSHVQALASLEVREENYNVTVTEIIVSKLPSDMRYSWSKHTDDKDSVSKLLEYLRLENDCRTYMNDTDKPHNTTKSFGRSDMSSTIMHNTASSSKNSISRKIDSRAPAGSASVFTPRKCVLCDNEHALDKCADFLNMSVEERVKYCKSMRLCFKCLKHNHSAKDCRSHISCGNCKGLHHTTLHYQNSHTKSTVASLPIGEKSLSETAGTSANCSFSTGTQCIALGTALVKVKNRDGIFVNARALIDTGSEYSYVRNVLASTIDTKNVCDHELTITGFSEHSEGPKVYPYYTFDLHGENKSCEIRALGTDKLCTAVPSVKRSHLLHLQNILSNTADNFDDESYKEIDIIIGCQHLGLIFTGRMKVGHPVAIESIFGWIILGRTPYGIDSPKSHSLTLLSVERPPCSDEFLKQFWQLDSLGVCETEEITSPAAYLDQYYRDICRDSNGRYLVSLPWKEPPCSLDTLERKTRVRFDGLQRRLAKDPALGSQIKSIFLDYVSKGYISKALDQGCATGRFIPYQPVIRNDKQSSKVRVVFDGSAVDTQQQSVNDKLYEGENLNPNIIGVLLRFRKGSVALVGDVKEAFLQIGISDNDSQFTKFFVQGLDDGNSICVYSFNRLPFGLRCSPFILTSVIHRQLENTFTSEVSSRIKREIYVDDYVASFSSQEDALMCKEDVRKCFADMQMHMHKFQSNVNSLNDPGYLESVSTRALGIVWNKQEDVLCCHVDEKLIEVDEPLTKRLFLKYASSVWDPLGIASPYVVRGKIIMQQTWVKGMDWDSLLEGKLKHQALSWIQELPQVCNLQVKRWIGPIREIHMYCDASQQAYAAVAYAYSVDQNEEWHATFIASKTRVAPTKRVSIPRLELLSATLATRLYKFLVEELTLHHVKPHFWTDSMVVWHWIHGGENEWKPFVSNRVREIHTVTNPSNWGHIPGKINPADIPSRGETVAKLSASTLWSQGVPREMLFSSVREESEPVVKAVVDKERKRVVCQAATVQLMSPWKSLFERFSSLFTLVNCVIYVLRFISNCRLAPEERCLDMATPNEFHSALIASVKLCQQSEFFEERLALTGDGNVGKTSKIGHLNPFIDDQGVIRSNRRLQNAKLLDYDTRFPIILPSKHPLTSLVIKETHDRLLHGPIDNVLIDLRCRYSIPKARQLVKSHIHNCCVCKWKRAKPYSTPCASLPSDRVNIEPAGCVFTAIGVDHFAMNAKDVGKCYGVIFTCAVSRAVHIELTPTLSCSDFLLAFDCYISRRGLPRVIYSDNATTFKAASSIIFKQYRIEWSFITERAPWMGGFWERPIGSIKTMLRNLLRARLVNFANLRSLLCKIEAVLNSKPLNTLTDDNDGAVPLTPAHFLVGRRFLEIPTSIGDGEWKNITLKQLFQNKTAFVKQLVEQWRRVYLCDLRQIKYGVSTPPSVNDLVLVDNDKAPHLWDVGVVCDLNRSRDNAVRSVRVKIGKKFYCRPVQRLFKMDM